MEPVMKHTDPAACLSCDLLKFIRNSKPTESELISWLGEDANVGRYHVLRKARLLLLDGDSVMLSPDHLSTDGAAFAFGNRIYKIDDDEIMIVCCNTSPQRTR
jgi:hypothetical protein